MCGELVVAGDEGAQQVVVPGRLLTFEHRGEQEVRRGRHDEVHALTEPRGQPGSGVIVERQLESDSDRVGVAAGGGGQVLRAQAGVDPVGADEDVARR